MTLHYADDWLTVHQGDCRDVLCELSDESVHCVVTSPPYWGLRDYGTATWIGGDEGCDHVQRMARGDAGRVSTDDRPGNINPAPVATPMRFRETCGKCGAVRQDSQLGLEPTPEEYVANLVAVFREVRRVLRNDGTLWLNLGDSYATGAGAVGERPGGGAQGDAWNGHRGSRGGSAKQPHTGAAIGPMTQPNRMPIVGLKPKDLVGIPWRVAFALQADGWYLRSDIIWAKPNPMPESVTDRPTKSHEYVFLLSKSARYFYDQAAVAEGLTESSVARLSQPTLDQQEGSDRVPGKTNGRMKAVGHLGPKMTDASDAVRATASARMGRGAGWRNDPSTQVGTRNLRSVWTVATQPYPGAHFATFPQKLVEPCIKAGSPELGLVLDPFAGTGTVGLVAQRLSRRALLIDLNTDYLDQLMRRNAQIPLGA